MRDQNIYTQDGLANIIRHIRLIKSFVVYEFAREEERLLLLYEAAQSLGTPVDARGKRWSRDLPKKQHNFGSLPPYLAQAVKSGEMVYTEGIG